jgi:hypothetical protein
MLDHEHRRRQIGGKDAHRRRSASTPPAEEPMTMMSLVCMRDSFVAKTRQ